jgi:hypothetical protein
VKGPSHLATANEVTTLLSIDLLPVSIDVSILPRLLDGTCGNRFDIIPPD